MIGRVVLALAATLLLRGDMYQDASNAALPAAINNLGIGPQLVSSPLCTTTAGSANVTACNSTGGVVAGQIVNGPGIPAGTKVADGITATGFTMTAPAAAGAGAGMVNLRPPFWSDVDGADPSLIRVPGRLMVGNAVGRSNTRSGAPNVNFDFCPTTSYCEQWAPRDADLAVMSQIGGHAIVGISKASLGKDIDPLPAPIGLGGYVINDALVNRSAWGVFVHAASDNAISSAKTWGVEIGMRNRGYNGTTTPYTEAGGPTGIAIRGDSAESFGAVATGPSNTAIYIAHGGGAVAQGWNKGIVFEKDAIVGNDGTTGMASAVEMARGHQVRWVAPNSQTGGYVTSEVTGSATQKSIVLDDGYVNFRGQGTQSIFRMSDLTGGSPGNYFRSYASASAGNPSLNAEGAATDITMVMTPKGAGYVYATAPVRTQGYTVATLPAGTVGMRAYVTDQTGACAQIGAAIAGGGALKCPVFHNGTVWVGG